ncbi:MAG: hypothetical protein HYW08_15170 [candidate division NC10 bacterium]|nr:hypothetical protein [candidate division NC10 bacterium]
MGEAGGRKLKEGLYELVEVGEEFGPLEEVITDHKINTQEELWFVNPVFAGERSRLRGKYVEKYERRGKGYVVMEADARGEEDRVLRRHRGVEILRIEPGPVVGKSTWSSM